MRKLLACTLALALLLCAMGSALAWDEIKIPSSLSELENPPEIPEIPKLNTKQSGSTMTVSVDGSVDKIVAQWRGFGEEADEELQLVDGAYTVDVSGHDYAIGQHYGNSFWSNTVTGEHTVNYWIDPDTPDSDIALNEGEYIVNVPTSNPTTVHYAPVQYAEYWDNDANANARISAADYAAGNYPSGVQVYVTNDWNNFQTISYEDWQAGKAPAGSGYGWTDYETWAHKEVRTRETTTESGVWQGSWEDNAFAVNFTDGLMVQYKRGGNPGYIGKWFNATDYFKNGSNGSWVEFGNLKQQNGSVKCYTSKIQEQYGSGDIASVTAVYTSKGRLQKYIVTYRTSDTETYEIHYNPADKAIYGYYTQKDADGNVVRACGTGGNGKWLNFRNELTPISDPFFASPRVY